MAVPRPRSAAAIRGTSEFDPSQTLRSHFERTLCALEADVHTLGHAAAKERDCSRFNERQRRVSGHSKSQRSLSTRQSAPRSCVLWMRVQKPERTLTNDQAFATEQMPPHH
jgi:hypothetical protein